MAKTQATDDGSEIVSGQANDKELKM